MHNRLLFLAALVLATACSDSNIGTYNSPPEATIELPSMGTEVLEGAAVTLRGVVEDRGSSAEELEVSWISSIDGELLSEQPDSEGMTQFTYSELSGGTHTITLLVRDVAGASGEDSVDLVVVADTAPSIAIVTPTAEGVYYSGLPVTLEATVDDAEDLPEDLRVSWAFDGGDTVVEDVTPDSAGTTNNNIDFAAGTHSLIATVTDTGGNTRTATVSFVVGPPNTAPDCAITAPVNLSSAPVGQLVLLEGTASDVDVASDLLTASFASSIDGVLAEVTPSTTGEIALPTTALTAGTHSVTLSVADEVGGTCSDFIVLTVSNPPSATIITPESITPLNSGDTLTLTGTVSDAEDPDDTLAVSWDSDVDGVLGTPSPDSSGAVALNFTLTAGPHLLTLTATDSAGLTGTDTVSVSVNTAPTAPVVSLLPVSPNTGDEITVNVDTPSTDPDDPAWTPIYDYAWARDGAPQPAHAGLDTVPSSATTRGESWEVTVIATDGQAFSAPALASVTIGNSAPSAMSAAITPANGDVSSTFTCVASGWSDADGDAEGYTYSWTVNSAPSVTTQTLAGSTVSSGDSLVCTATPFDGILAGSPVVSPPVVVANSPPSIASVSISPGTGTETTVFTCLPSGWSDPDGDSPGYLYQWSVDGTPSVTTTTISGASFDKNQALVCTVTPTDGLLSGSPVDSGSVLVQNTPPTLALANITPTSPTEGSTLQASPVGPFDADGDSVTYSYAWYVDSGLVAAVTAPTLTGSFFDKGQSVYVEITPQDGDDSGNPVNSAPVLIGNTPPTVAQALISPTSGGEATTFTCLGFGGADVDLADSVSFTYAWTVNGAPSGTSQTLDGASFDSGDSIACTATPYDGEDSGSGVTSALLVIDNTPPSITSVGITPTTAYTDTTLTATPSGWSDADGATPSYLYEWFAGSAAVGTNSSTLVGSYFSKGEAITVQVTPQDASSSGSPVTSSGVIILNTAPTTPGVSITPSAPDDSEDLVCSVSTPSADLDTDPITYGYTWLVDSAATSYVAATLPAAATAGEEAWTCEVTPNDGEEDGAPASASVSVTDSICTDLNCDGYTDIVFANHTNNSTNLHIDSSIYWGSATGYSVANSTGLPTVGAEGTTIHDLDGDGYLDIVFANYKNNSGNRNIDSYIYWGSATGYSTANRTELPTVGGRVATIHDLNGDSYPDIVFSNYYSGSNYSIASYIYWGSATGYSISNRTDLPTVGAYKATVHDLNGDGYPEIVFANNRSGNTTFNIDSYIYWGSGSGYSTANRTSLPTAGAVSTTVDDLDGDGYPDIVFANYQSGSSTFDIDSYIYWGSSTGYSTANRSNLPTSGASDTAVHDLDGDGYPDIVFVNRINNSQNHNIDSYIYWGSAAGYSTANRTGLPTQGGQGVTVHDLDGDGDPELLFANNYDNSSFSIDSYIYWGSAGGYSTANRTGLPTAGGADVSVE